MNVAEILLAIPLAPKAVRPKAVYTVQDPLTNAARVNVVGAVSCIGKAINRNSPKRAITRRQI